MTFANGSVDRLEHEQISLAIKEKNTEQQVAVLFFWDSTVYIFGGYFT